MFPSGSDINGPVRPFGDRFNGGEGGNKPPEWLMGAAADEYNIDAGSEFGGELGQNDDAHRVLSVGLHFFQGLKDI